MEHFQFIHCNQFNFMPLHEIVRPLVRRLAISVYFWGKNRLANWVAVKLVGPGSEAFSA